MAADTAITHMVFFIASILVAASIAGVIIAVSNNMANDLVAKENGISDTMQTNIEIINDPRIVPYNDNNLTIYIQNTGDITLNYNDITILIDGHIMDATISVITDNMTQGSANQNGNWAPSTIISVEVNCGLDPGRSYDESGDDRWRIGHYGVQGLNWHLAVWFV